MFRLLQYEIVKMFLKKRTLLGFLIVAVIVPLVEVTMKIEGGHFLQMATRSLQRDFFFVGNLFNGWLVSHQMMNSLWFHIPLLISFVAGDQLAGEATAGTYRLILIRPVSRTKIFFAKYAASVIYTVAFVGFLGLLSVGLALALLGGGNLLVIERTLLLLPADDVAWRFLVGYLLAMWSMLTIASLAFFFSSFVENAIGPIIATMGVLIIFQIVTFLPLEAFNSVRPYLFTPYLNLWQRVFAYPVAWEEVAKGASCLGAYSIASVLAAWVIFVRKDILS